ncbi:MAG: VWA domain-containing protein [Bacteroidaceae bacterium]|nr:VWA domain-containing protein [Bacteroidaceae bacterium]
MKTRIFNLVIIDESGSMHSIKRQAIASVNETFQTIRSAQQKYPEQEHYVTLVTFNNDVKTVYDGVPVEEVRELTDATYQPDCCTALHDAMGMSLTALRKQVAEADRVLVTIVTDGYENASREYSGSAIKALVEELKGRGWVFAYIGADHDVEAVAEGLSINNRMSFEKSEQGTKNMSVYLNESREKMFSFFCSESFDSKIANECFFEE